MTDQKRTIAEERQTVVNLRALAREQLGRWFDDNVFRPLREVCDRAGLVDVKIEVHPFDFYGHQEPVSFRVYSARTEDRRIISWVDAEQLRHMAVPIQCRDRANHLSDWSAVIGAITEHCSDLEFRVGAAVINEPRFKYGRPSC